MICDIIARRLHYALRRRTWQADYLNKRRQQDTPKVPLSDFVNLRLRMGTILDGYGHIPMHSGPARSLHVSYGNHRSCLGRAAYKPFSSPALRSALNINED